MGAGCVYQLFAQSPAHETARTRREADEQGDELDQNRKTETIGQKLELGAERGERVADRQQRQQYRPY